MARLICLPPPPHPRRGQGDQQGRVRYANFLSGIPIKKGVSFLSFEFAGNLKMGFKKKNLKFNFFSGGTGRIVKL
jgi:hypothetical protein